MGLGDIYLYGDGASSLWGNEQKSHAPGEGFPPGVPRPQAPCQLACEVGVQPLTAAGAPVGQETVRRAGHRCCGQHKVSSFQPRGRANFTTKTQKVREWWPGWAGQGETRSHRLWGPEINLIYLEVWTLGPQGGGGWWPRLLSSGRRG